MLGTLLLRNEIGMTLQVSVDSVDDAYAKMREFGAHGWISGDPVNRVIEFPLAMADLFDWSLIGAREFTMTDRESGEVIRCVAYRGEVYKRRHLPANERKKMPEAVKFSRGAHKDDPPEIVEDGGGDFKYVSLAIFRGNAPVIGAFCKPKAGAAQPPSEPSSPHAGNPTVALTEALSELTDEMREHLRERIRNGEVTPSRLLLLARSVHPGPVPRTKFRALVNLIEKDKAA